MSSVHTPSFLIGAAAAAIVAFVAILVLHSEAERGQDPRHDPAAAAADAAARARDRAAERPSEGPAGKAAAERSEILTIADLRQLLASGKRLDQIRAIELLIGNGTPEAIQALLDSFLASNDAVLLALLEDAMTKSTLDLAPGLMDALRSATDSQKLARLAGLLTQIVGKRPELESQIVGMFVRALGDPNLKPEQAKAVEDAIVALGARALDPLAAYLLDPKSDPTAAGMAAAALSRLGAAHAGALREKVKDGIEAMRKSLEDPALTAEEKDTVRKKTGSLAWIVGNRPAAEHDLLAHDLVESFVRAKDPAQAGTLAWGMTNLKGLSDRGRLDTVQSILDALPNQNDGALRQSYAWAVSQIVSAGYEDRPLDANFTAMKAAAEAAWKQHQNDAQMSAPLAKLVDQLKAYEKKKGG